MSDDFDKDFSWLDDSADDDKRRPADQDDDLDLDWLKDVDDDAPRQTDSERTGVTGQLSWKRATQGDQPQRYDDDELPDFDWESETPSGVPGDSMRTGVTGQLNWQQDHEDSFERQLNAAENAARERGEETGLPDWMQSDTEDEDAFADLSGNVFDESDTADEADDMPDWLRGVEESPAPVTTPSAFSSFDDDDYIPTEQEDSDALPDWLVGADNEEDRPMPDWMRTTEAPVVTSPPSAYNAPSEDFEVAEILPDWLRDAAPQQEEPSEDATLAALFSDDDDEDVDIDALVESATRAQRFDDFSEEDFSAYATQEEDDFDFLGTSSARTGLTGMLGELSDDVLRDADSTVADFDLLGELSGDEGDSTPIADAVAGDDDFLARAEAEGFGLSDDDDGLDMSFLDSLGFGDDEPQADPFRDAFDAPRQPARKPVVEDDLSWLSGITEDDVFVEPANAEPEYASVDDFLATLDDDKFELPDTGSLEDYDRDIDLDSLFDDDSLSDIDYDTGMGQERPSLSPDAPTWLTDLSQETAGNDSAAAMARQQQADRPIEDLDARLQDLRQRGLNLNVRNVTGDTPAIERIIPGVSNTLPAVVFDPGDVEVLTGVVLSPEQQRNAELLRTVASGTSQEGLGARRRRPRILTDRLVIGVLLLLVLIIPFFTDVLNVGDRPAAQFVPGTPGLTFFTLVDQTQPGDLVLIAAEYGPSGAAELDNATDALFRHVLARGGTPVVVSGNALGLLRVESQLDALATENNLTRNEDYVVGSYLVSDVIGLRNFAHNIDRYVGIDAQGEDTGLSVTSLEDFALIVLVSENAERIRAYAEQVAPITDTPIIVVSSQSAAPFAEPYLRVQNTDGILAYLVGYRDGETYRSMLTRLIDSEGMVDFYILPTETPTLVPSNTPVPTETATEAPTVIPTETDEEAVAPAETDEDVTPAASEEIAATDATPGDEQAPTESPTPIESPTPTESLTPTESPTPTDSPTPTETFTPTFTPTPELVRIAIVVADSAVNVRPDPSTLNPPVGVLEVGGRALVIGEETNDLGELWYNIRFQNVNGDVIDGWLRSDLIDVEEVVPTPAPTLTPTPDGDTNAGLYGKLADDPGVDKSQDDGFATLTAVAATVEAFNASAQLDLTAAFATAQAFSVELDPTALAATAQAFGGEVDLTALAATAQAFGGEVDLTALAATAQAFGGEVDLTAVFETMPDFEVTLDLELTAEPEATRELVPLVRDIAPPATDDQRDARWYSMTLGILFAVVVIAGGSIFNVLRAMRRTDRKERK